MRALTEQAIASNPDLLAVSEIDDGDALALATKTNRQWSYRGGQALLWRTKFASFGLHESYLAPALRSLQWRGVLRVDLRAEETEVSLLTTRFAPDRRRVRDLRAVRSLLRDAPVERMILCITNPPPKGDRVLSDLGFATSDCVAASDALMAVRGCELRSSATIAGGDMLGTQILAHVRA
jgi:hypothetical protein